MKRRAKISVPRIIQPHTFRWRWLIVGAVLSLIALTGWLAFDYGVTLVVGDGQRNRTQIAVLKNTISELKEHRSALKKKVAALETAANIDKQAALQLKSQIKKLQDERLKLQEDLAFLRGIVSMDGSTGGLRIQGFALTSTGQSLAYRYKFTVSQLLNNPSLARGKILISIAGVQNGESKTLSLQDMSEDKSESLKMRFRHFQNVEGILSLPEGFVPDNLTVEVVPTSKRLAKITQTFDWVVGG